MAAHASLCAADQSQLILIDLQVRLMAAMPPATAQRVRGTIGQLLAAAQLLEIPIWVSEQYPQGLGATEPELLAQLAKPQRFEKTSFSLGACTEMCDALAQGARRQLILCGVESHVCVLQSALDLQAAGYAVYVAADATCARNPQHHTDAMMRLRAEGVMISCVESILFEWLRDAAHPHFRAISQLLR